VNAISNTNSVTQEKVLPPRTARRFRAFSFTDYSGEYAFYFSTGIGIEPLNPLSSKIDYVFVVFG
jgi:hypothetical protein